LNFLLTSHFSNWIIPFHTTVATQKATTITKTHFYPLAAIDIIHMGLTLAIPSATDGANDGHNCQWADDRTADIADDLPVWCSRFAAVAFAILWNWAGQNVTY